MEHLGMKLSIFPKICAISSKKTNMGITTYLRKNYCKNTLGYGIVENKSAVYHRKAKMAVFNDGDTSRLKVFYEYLDVGVFYDVAVAIDNT